MKPLIDIDLNDYDYHLPDKRIAQYPIQERDHSRILIKGHDGCINQDTFKNLSKYVQKDSCMVFNNSRVIPARLIFNLSTESFVEIFCLKPVDPSDYQLSMQTSGICTWQCMIGNKRRFKKNALEKKISIKGMEVVFRAEKLNLSGYVAEIRFTWDNASLNFAEILEQAGRIPLPPYIKRPDKAMDRLRYQTIYSRVDGSVAAPTAGLHFTENILSKLREKNVHMVNVTLHVGAGTFLPVKTSSVYQHNMHAEYFSVSYEDVEKICNAAGPVIAVGTTAARTIESLYWLGVKQSLNKAYANNESLVLQQWEAYHLPDTASFHQSFRDLLTWMQNNGLREIHAHTKLMIVPGYVFRVANALLTNFHQPRSTLLLLLAAFTGDSWKDVYAYAMNHNFRFLSYGDCSLFY
ncbi:MAG: S-adenosylmethionine:tRNA ribosyltransferase-isomerase [Bacteroidales bacterium]|nr:S-adenosylmethionine:tRNA ribosyltransferase-isomerase [Bacteroidales bacterium]